MCESLNLCIMKHSPACARHSNPQAYPRPDRRVSASFSGGNTRARLCGIQVSEQYRANTSGDRTRGGRGSGSKFPAHPGSTGFLDFAYFAPHYPHPLLRPDFPAPLRACHRQQPASVWNPKQSLTRGHGSLFLREPAFYLRLGQDLSCPRLALFVEGSLPVARGSTHVHCGPCTIRHDRKVSTSRDKPAEQTNAARRL